MRCLSVYVHARMWLVCLCQCVCAHALAARGPVQGTWYYDIQHGIDTNLEVGTAFHSTLKLA